MKKKLVIVTISSLLAMTFLVGCEKNTTDKTLSTKQETSDEDVIASGNGTGGTGSSSSSKDKDITSFAYSDKKKAPDGTKIISDKDYKIEDCVTLPDLQSMTVVCPMAVITDDEAEGYIRGTLDAKPLTGSDVTAKRWDKLTIDYTTSYKNKELDQSRTGMLAIIGSYGLPEKVEQSLIGHHIGDRFKVDVKFPATYEGNPTFAGKKITYNIKIQGIARTKDPSADEIAKAKASLQKDAGSSMLFSKYEATAQHIEDRATFKAYPKKYMEEARIAYELEYIGDFKTVANYAKEKGIPVANVPTYGTQIVGQYAVGLLMEICSHYGHHAQTVAEGKWENNADWCYWDYPMIELYGKTAGIIGLGRIGQATAKILNSMDMKVKQERNLLSM